MIYLITGQPGAGKSLYAVSTMVKKLLSEKLELNGKKLDRRLCVDGVNDLIIPHEKMADGAEDGAGVLGEAEGFGLWNWYDWCKPGDVIFIDEVQRWWRPRGMGTKPPKMIKELETHRHKGVDFVIVTQHPMLIDQNVRRLVNRHIHVRRIFGMARSMLYDWDGCQADTSRVSGASKSVWSYPRDAYKLYKSAELHTKQRQKIPVWLFFPVIVALLAVFVGPGAYDTMHRTMTGKSLTDAPKSSASAAPAGMLRPAVPQGQPAAAGSMTPTPAANPVAPPASQSAAAEDTFAGCVASASGCRCYDQSGKLQTLSHDSCTHVAKSSTFDAIGAGYKTAPQSPQLTQHPTPAATAASTPIASGGNQMQEWQVGLNAPAVSPRHSVLSN